MATLTLKARLSLATIAARIEGAAQSLCDWVYEYNCGHGELGCRFNQEQRDIIARMVAVGMMNQFEHDLEAECRLMASLDDEGCLRAIYSDPVKIAEVRSKAGF